MCRQTFSKFEYRVTLIKLIFQLLHDVERSKEVAMAAEEQLASVKEQMEDMNLRLIQREEQLLLFESKCEKLEMKLTAKEKQENANMKTCQKPPFCWTRWLMGLLAASPLTPRKFT